MDNNHFYILSTFVGPRAAGAVLKNSKNLCRLLAHIKLSVSAIFYLMDHERSFIISDSSTFYIIFMYSVVCLSQVILGLVFLMYPIIYTCLSLSHLMFLITPFAC